jgi:hypothetical protein
MGVLNQEERARRKLIFGLANCKNEDLIDLERRFHISVDSVFGKVLNALLELSLIRLGERGIAYTEDGLCRLEEISYFLGSDGIKDACSQPAPHDCHEREVRSHHYYVRIPERHRRLFEAFVASQPAEFMCRLKSPADYSTAVNESRDDNERELVTT